MRKVARHKDEAFYEKAFTVPHRETIFLQTELARITQHPNSLGLKMRPGKRGAGGGQQGRAAAEGAAGFSQ